jgi:hypothetical protein
MPLSARRVLRTFRYAMYFDGVDDYVVVSSSMVGSVISRAPLTINILLFMFPDYGMTYTYASTYLRAYYGFILQKTNVNHFNFYVGTGTSWIYPGLPV